MFLLTHFNYFLFSYFLISLFFFSLSNLLLQYIISLNWWLLSCFFRSYIYFFFKYKKKKMHLLKLEFLLFLRLCVGKLTMFKYEWVRVNSGGLWRSAAILLWYKHTWRLYIYLFLIIIIISDLFFFIFLSTAYKFEFHH